MKLPSRKDLLFVIPVLCVYIILTIISANHCYFWDNIQQISKEAHWYYLTDFKHLLMPDQNSGAEITGTGYHPPLMGLMTALLWKVFGYNLWVSHVFVFFWLLILIYNVWKLISRVIPEKFVGWVLLISLLEPTVLSQFSTASPDFILFTAFILSVRALLEQKQILLSIGIFFICCINMRGIFVGAILFITNCYYSYIQANSRFNIRSFLKIIVPYLPTLLLLIGYFTYYFIVKGWFFKNSTSTDHYSIPTSFGRIIKHFAEFGLRSVENGRILIWTIGIYTTYIFVKSKTPIHQNLKVLVLFFLLLTGLYILFIFITQMPFSARYFMPQFFLLTLLTLSGIIQIFEKKRIWRIFVLVLIFEISGNFWIYPERIAKSWDCTLAHLSYYELRNECFNYIDQQKLDYKEISGGFCLYGNRRFIEMNGEDKDIGTDVNSKYFIYSNISNVEDSFADSLKNPKLWIPIKSFKRGFVYIIIYKNKLPEKKNSIK
ncbi:MAG: hypothetical protein P4L34_13620 [Paludibacter sp.]|nr:hypothetical protein [Paludibacter sp.]